jgi:hypothetical protein
VLDDEDPLCEQTRVCGTGGVPGVIDASAVHADQPGLAANQNVNQLLGYVRTGIPVAFGPPQLIPSRPDKDGSSAHKMLID